MPGIPRNLVCLSYGMMGPGGTRSHQRHAHKVKKRPTTEESHKKKIGSLTSDVWRKGIPGFRELWIWCFVGSWFFRVLDAGARSGLDSGRGSCSYIV